MAVTEKIKYADLDEEGWRAIEARRAQEHARAIVLAHEAVVDLQRQGILDANRERIRKDIPVEMREGSDADMSSL